MKIRQAVDNERKGRVKKCKFFHASFFLLNKILFLLKKGYNSPYPINRIFIRFMQHSLFSFVYCEIYRDSVR